MNAFLHMTKYSERSACFVCGSIVFRLVIMCLYFLFLERIYAPFFMISTSRSNKRCKCAILSLSRLNRSLIFFSTSLTRLKKSSKPSLNELTCEHLSKKSVSSTFARNKEAFCVVPVANAKFYLTMFRILTSRLGPMRNTFFDQISLILSTMLFLCK